MVVRRRLTLTGPSAVFVTTTIADWKPIFSDAKLADCAIEILSEAAIRFDVSVCAYVIMPSHIHLLLGFPEIEQLSDFMQILKQGISRRIKEESLPETRREFSTTGSFVLWKPRFDDLIIVSEEQFRIKASYIHNNPVKPGLVAYAEDYPYSSARFWFTGKEGALPIDNQWRWSR